MKKRKVKIALILSLILIFAVIAIIIILILLTPNPPLETINAAREAIAMAKKEEAHIYSPDKLSRAEASWNSCMLLWNKNNMKSSILRDYDSVLLYAKNTIQLGGEAAVHSREKKLLLKKEIELDLAHLTAILQYITELTGKLPLNHHLRKKTTPLFLMLKQAQSAYDRDSLISADAILNKVNKSVESVKDEASNLLEEYFNSYPVWIKLDSDMRQWSAKHSASALVIDKFSRKCIVYRSGKKIREFDVELGINWLGDKIQRGDKATPEGKYKIIAKKSGKNTIYHKALLINFPNDEDLSRFKKLKSTGNLPQSANIGGLIEIHGGGGRGIDWTDGCIALENKEMDILFSLCSVDTPVAIVGSLISLEEILSKL